MNPYALMAIGSFACTAIQGVDSFFSLRDRSMRKSLGADMTSSRVQSGWFAASLITGAVVTAILGTALLMYHPKPITVEKTVTVEKAIPCPPAQTGDATSKGGNSPAMSGSNNSVNYGETPPPKKP